MKNEIERQLVNQRLAKETAAQIKKDFSLNGIEIDLGFAYFEMLKTIVHKIEDLKRSDNEKLLRLLYTIDLSERDALNVEELSSEPEGKRLAHLIIQRCLKKVLIRNFIKSGGKP